MFSNAPNCAMSLEFFIDLLAVWRLGACAIPIDGRLVPSEVATLAGSARPKLSIWAGPPAEATMHALRDLNVTAIGPGSDEGAFGVNQALPDSSFALDDDALILFTSGTTGDPKGVVHTHRTLRARWAGLHSSLGIEAFRRSLCLLPTHFGHGPALVGPEYTREIRFAVVAASPVSALAVPVMNPLI